MNCRVTGLAVSALAIVVSAAAGDDLTGREQILCAAVHVTECQTSGDCRVEPPWNLNIPQFLQLDLKERTMAATAASGENRITPIRSMTREGGEIVLQGFEAGRAFSFVIEETTGMASVAIAREGMTVSVFGACTPMPAGN